MGLEVLRRQRPTFGGEGVQHLFKIKSIFRTAITAWSSSKSPKAAFFNDKTPNGDNDVYGVACDGETTTVQLSRLETDTY